MSDPANSPASPRAADASGEPVTLGEFNRFEIYPMPMFATLAVADVAAVAQWYVEALGFGIMFQAPPVNGQSPMIHIRRRKYQDLLIVPASAAPADGPAPSSLTLSFQAEDVDALARQARSASAVGASSVAGPVDTQWNTRDLRVTDPAGHRLVFTSRSANPDPRQLERWTKTFAAARNS